MSHNNKNTGDSFASMSNSDSSRTTNNSSRRAIITEPQPNVLSALPVAVSSSVAGPGDTLSTHQNGPVDPARPVYYGPFLPTGSQATQQPEDVDEARTKLRRKLLHLLRKGELTVSEWALMDGDLLAASEYDYLSLVGDYAGRIVHGLRVVYNRLRAQGQLDWGSLPESLREIDDSLEKEAKDPGHSQAVTDTIKYCLSSDAGPPFVKLLNFNMVRTAIRDFAKRCERFHCELGDQTRSFTRHEMSEIIERDIARLPARLPDRPLYVSIMRFFGRSRKWLRRRRPRRH